MYDLIIIGSGPAGMTAGIYAARREMKTLIIGRELGGQVMWATEIENYPGIKSIGNIELIEKWREHVTGLGVEIVSGEVGRIAKNEDGSFQISTTTANYSAKTVIIAMGLVPRRLAIPGENELAGKGISYCANCDGPFYRNKTVAVIGGGNSALDAAEVLSKIAKQVYLVHRREEFRGFESLVQEVRRKTNIEVCAPYDVVRINGSERVEGLEIVNNQTKESRILALDGIFIEIGRIAHTDLVADLIERNDQLQLIVDDRCRTKTPGIFAAGDVTNVPYKQITIACGQATIAALSAYEYIQRQQGVAETVVFDRGHKQIKQADV